MSKKFVILFTVFIDILGIGIIIPVLPFYVKSFGASNFTVTLLFSVFALFSFFSAPLLGAISDRIGRRPVLIFSIFSSAVGWLVFAGAHSLSFLFLGRIIDGAAAGNISIAQNYLVDIAKDAKERTANLGLIGAMFGIGLTVGPMIGGMLAGIYYSLPFWTVGIMASINVVLAYFYLPEVHYKKNELIKFSFNPFAPIISALSNKVLLPSFTAWFLFGLAVASYQAVFALYLAQVFGYTEFITGIFLTFSGIGIALNQILLRKFWLKKFSEPNLELNMFLVLGTGFLLMAWPNLITLIIGLMLLTVSQSLIRPITTSLVAGASGHKSGEALGVLTSLISLSAIIGPIGAGYILGRDSFWPFLISGFYALLAYLALLANRRKINKIRPEIDSDMNAIC